MKNVTLVCFLMTALAVPTAAGAEEGWNKRFASWGAIVGLGLSLPLLSVIGGTAPLQLLFAGTLTMLGAGSAAGSLALARRAEDRDLLAGVASPGAIEGTEPIG